YLRYHEQTRKRNQGRIFPAAPAGETATGLNQFSRFEAESFVAFDSALCRSAFLLLKTVTRCAKAWRPFSGGPRESIFSRAIPMPKRRSQTFPTALPTSCWWISICRE